LPLFCIHMLKMKDNDKKISHHQQFLPPLRLSATADVYRWCLHGMW
jgi:hypothetical protein